MIGSFLTTFVSDFLLRKERVIKSSRANDIVDSFALSFTLSCFYYRSLFVAEFLTALTYDWILWIASAAFFYFEE